MRNFVCPLPVLPIEHPGDVVAGDDDGGDLLVAGRLQELRERDLVVLGSGDVVEKFQIRTPTTTRTIQNNKLLRVEFNLGLLTALLSRISRHVRGP